MDKKHLFISQNGKADIQLETYTFDDKGYLKDKAIVASIPQLGIDARLSLLELAIYEKIKIHHKLGANQVTLVESVDKILAELSSKSTNLTIRFDSPGRPPADNYIYFDKEDPSIPFHLSIITKDTYQKLKNQIQEYTKGPLSIFSKIYVPEALSKQNSLFSLLAKEEQWGDRIVSDNAEITERNAEFKATDFLTPKQIDAKEREKQAIEAAARKVQEEKGTFANLEKSWQSDTKDLGDKIEECKVYLEKYPQFPNSTTVEAKQRRLKDDYAWEKAKKANTTEAYVSYMAEYKDGAYTEAAKSSVLEIGNRQGKDAVETLEAYSSEREKLQVENQRLAEKERKFKRQLVIVGVIMAVLLAGFGISRLFITKHPVEISEPPIVRATGSGGETLTPVISEDVMKERINCTLKSISDSLKLNNLEGKVRTKLYSDEIKLKDILDIPVQDYQKTLTSMEVSIHSKCK
jgi:hypothetical protein